MSINLSTHKTDILNAFNRVVDKNDSHDWALLGYDGKSNTLNVLEMGSDGLGGLSAAFNAGQIQYGIAAIDCPTTGQPKIMLIHWQGEGVAISRQGACTSHFYEVKNFLKGVHVTHHARNEEDVEPEVLLATLSKVTSSLGICAQSQNVSLGQKDVGSVYKRVEVKKDINLSDRDKFWADREREEQERVDTENRRLQEQAAAIEGEKKWLASRLHQECENKLEESGKQRASNTAEHANKLRNVSDQIRLERLNEANELIGQTGNLKTMWETKGRPEKLYSPTSPTQSNGTFTGPQPIRSVRGKWPPSPVKENTPEPTPPSPIPKVQFNKPVAVNNNNNNNNNVKRDIGKLVAMNEVGSVLNTQPVPEPKLDANDSHLNAEDDSRIGVGGHVPSAVPLAPIKNEYTPPPPPTPPSSVHAPEVYPEPPHQNGAAVFRDVLPPRQDSEDEETNEQDWDDDPVLEEDLDRMQVTVSNGHAPKSDPKMGVKAEALWDYQASDETEVSFDPGQVITQIEMIDPGWWRGRAPNGAYGLFPANYVQLLQP